MDSVLKHQMFECNCQFYVLSLKVMKILFVTPLSQANCMDLCNLHTIFGHYDGLGSSSSANNSIYDFITATLDFPFFLLLLSHD